MNIFIAASRLTAAVIVASMLAGCGGSTTTPPVQSQLSKTLVPSDCLNVTPATAKAREKPMLTTCPGPPPPIYQTCMFFCGDPNPQLMNDGFRCMTRTPVFDYDNVSCLPRDAAYACVQDGWDCNDTPLCKNFYYDDMQAAPKLIEAYVVLGYWTTALGVSLLNIEPIAAWAEAATGLSASVLKTVAGINTFYNTALAATGRATESIQDAHTSIADWNQRVDTELAYGCTNAGGVVPAATTRA